MKRVAFVALIGQSEAVHVNQLSAPVDKTNIQLTHKDTQEGLATDEDIDDAMTSIQHLAEYEKKAGQKEADDQKREAEYKMIQNMEKEKKDKKKKEDQEQDAKDAKVKAEKQKKTDEEKSKDKKAKDVVQAKEKKAKDEKEAAEKKIRDEQEAKEKKIRQEKEAADKKANEIRLAAEAKVKAEKDAKIAVENKELNRMMAKATDKMT